MHHCKESGRTSNMRARRKYNMRNFSRAILKELGFFANVHSRPLDPFNKKLCIYIYALYLFIYCGHR